MLTAKDKEYWLWKEKDITKHLISLADCGFIFACKTFEGVRAAKDSFLLRPGVAEALIKARGFLPKGHNFKIYDGWRPWVRQKKAAALAKRMIQKDHPDWSRTQVARQLWMMAPPQRIITKLNSHRYGGAVDLTVVDASGHELDMGVPVDYVSGPEAGLLFYELNDKLTRKQVRFRDNRRLLIKAMEKADFSPYLPEFWHWSYEFDLGHL
jgi:zinc D-Ala-D-Ala dipeptidase